MSIPTLETFCGCYDLKTGIYVMGGLKMIPTLRSIADYSNLLTLSINKTSDIAAISTLLLISILDFLFILVLFLGTRKNYPNMLKMWMYYTPVSFLSMYILGISYIAVLGGNVSPIVGEAVVVFFGTAYFWLVVKSQYLLMTTPESTPLISNESNA